MSSKNPRETRGNREVTAWDRDSQGTVKPGRVWILKASPLLRATHGAAVVMENWVPPRPRSPKPLSTPLTQSERPPKPEVDTTRNMDPWALRTPGHLRQLRRSCGMASC